MHWHGAVYAIIVAVNMTVLGCGSPAGHAWPTHPIYFAEEGSWKTTIRPVDTKEVLLVPYYTTFDRKTSSYQRVVARPFFCKPEATIILPRYKAGYDLRGVVALAPGYFGFGIPINFYSTREINSKRYQVVYAVKARNKAEADRILQDFKWLLSQKKVTLGTTRNPLTIEKNERHVYATSTDFSTPSDYAYSVSGQPNIHFSLWRFEHGTELSVDLTNKDKEMVNRFIEKHLKPDTALTNTQTKTSSDNGQSSSMPSHNKAKKGQDNPKGDNSSGNTSEKQPTR